MPFFAVLRCAIQFSTHGSMLQGFHWRYESCIEDIWERCKQIKESIRTENDLESLRKELSARVQLTSAAGHAVRSESRMRRLSN